METWNESAWFAMAVGAALKGSVILGAAWLLARALRRRSAAARHLVWTAAAAALLALPVLSLSLPAWRVRSRTLQNFVPPITFHITATGRTSGHPLSASMGAAVSRATPAGSPRRLNYSSLVPILWAAGTLAGIVQMLAAALALQRVRRASSAPVYSEFFYALAHGFDIHDCVDLIESPAGTMPMSFGILRPAVFLPADAAEWSEERRRMVLLHELAHVRRGDVATNLMMRTALCLFWWNPLAWMAWRESVRERERAADDLVLAAGEAATGYAGHLLDIARSMQSTAPVAWAAVAMARPSQLEGRLLAILDSHIHRGATGPRAAAAAAILAIVAIAPFAAVQAQDKVDPATAAVVEAAIKAATIQNNPDITDSAAAAYASSQKFTAAQTLLENSLSIRGKKSGETSTAYATGLIKLGDLSAKRGKTADAVDFYTRAVALGDTPETATGLIYLAGQASVAEDLSKADSLIDRAIAAAPKGPVAARALALKGDIAWRNGLDGVAEQQYQRALDQVPNDSTDASPIMEKYGMLLRSQNRLTESQAMLNRAMAGRATMRMTASASPSASGVYSVGNGVSAPVVLSKTEPIYSEAARAAKYQGTVILAVVIGVDGHATDIKVIKSLGLGLDENAVAAVSQWTFAPGKREGVPVPVQATLEVNFRLL